METFETFYQSGEPNKTKIKTKWPQQRSQPKVVTRIFLELVFLFALGRVNFSISYIEK